MQKGIRLCQVVKNPERGPAERSIMAQEMVGGKKERHLNEKAKGRAYRKDRMIAMNLVQSRDEHEALTPFEGGFYVLKIRMHVMLDSALAFLPGFCKVVERQQQQIDNNAHADECSAVGSKDCKAFLKHGLHQPFKRGYKKSIEIFQHCLLFLSCALLHPVAYFYQLVCNDRACTAKIVDILIAEPAQAIAEPGIIQHVTGNVCNMRNIF